MPTSNKYIIRSRISEAKFRQVLKLFCLDLNATQIAELSGLSRNTINSHLMAIRTRIAEYCQDQSPFSGHVEVDESYFGARRTKGIRGRGARGKKIVFGIYKCDGKVYTEIMPDVSRNTLQGVIRGKISLDIVIYSNGWCSYNGLVDLCYAKHLRVDHGVGEFVQAGSHINGIEGFWGYAKTHLTKCRGMHPNTFN